MKLRKKLIEVALPLDAINKASAREKSIRHGHPSTLHLWWARRPLAAARAVIFSQMVDDPSEYVDVLKMDDKLRRKAERVLNERHTVWVTATEVKRKADVAGIESPDPGPEPTLDDIIAEKERDRLFKIIEDLVVWENTTNETVLEKARAEIWQSWRRTCADNADHPRARELFDRNKLPAFHDPFAGGGALPLEAQRLGLEAYASDLNPVAVLINKAMIEIPSKFAGMPPVNSEWQSKPDAEKAMKVWRGAEGLAEDVRYYGKWMRDEAEKRIGHLYPKAHVTEEMAKDRPDLKRYVGKKLTVIAWIWARTVKSPNPAFRDVDVPLASTFVLSERSGKYVYVDPAISSGGYSFNVRTEKPKNLAETISGTKLARGANFRCLMSDMPIPGDYIYSEGMSGRMSARLMAIVVESDRGRLYLDPTQEQERIALGARPEWRPEQLMPLDRRWFSPPLYGMPSYGDIFSARQLTILTALSDLVEDVREVVRAEANRIGEANDDRRPLDKGGRGYVAYAEAVCAYLGLGISKTADYGATLVGWSKSRDQAVHVFGRQALPMVWDYAEVNPFAGAAGDLSVSLAGITRTIANSSVAIPGTATQNDAQTQQISRDRIISTDPPYYDNIGYADLSDFFYVWLRRSLKSTFPDLFSTLGVPKTEELVATPYRHGGKRAAETFFLEGMTQAMRNLAVQAHPILPVTIYYAFKQSETSSSQGTTNTGWDTFLAAVIEAGFAINGTWPMRTERQGRMVGNDTNALASSIILVCRRRAETVPTATRREFVNALKSELPEALRHLQRGNIAPVDLAQAAIGPGMAVYTRYEKVLDAEGKALSVRDALALINQTLDTVLAEQEGDFDADTRWALTWFEENGFDSGEFGRAEQLSKAKNTSISEMADPRTSPILEAKAGKVRLFRPEELEEDWTPESDGRLTVWDMVHQMIRILEKNGETAAAGIVRQLGAKAETARELCYRLYTICERKKRPNDALSYNALVQSWPELVRLAQIEVANLTQGEMFENT